MKNTDTQRLEALLLDLGVPRGDFNAYIRKMTGRGHVQVWRWLKGKKRPPTYVFEILELQKEVFALRNLPPA